MLQFLVFFLSNLHIGDAGENKPNSRMVATGIMFQRVYASVAAKSGSTAVIKSLKSPGSAPAVTDRAENR